MELTKLKLVILRYLSIATSESNKYISLSTKPFEKTIASTSEEKEAFLKNELHFTDNFMMYVKLFMATNDSKEIEYSNSEIFMSLNFLKHLGFILQENGGDKFRFRISKLGTEFLSKQRHDYMINPKFEQFFESIE